MQHYHQKEKILTPIEALKEENTTAVHAQLRFEKTKKENKPWYIEVLEGERCAHFFLDQSSCLKPGKNCMKRIEQWIKVNEVSRALNIYELTIRDIHLLEIPLLSSIVVDKIKTAYKKNKRNQNQ